MVCGQLLAAGRDGTPRQVLCLDGFPFPIQSTGQLGAYDSDAHMVVPQLGDGAIERVARQGLGFPEPAAAADRPGQGVKRKVHLRAVGSMHAAVDIQRFREQRFRFDAVT